MCNLPAERKVYISGIGTFDPEFKQDLIKYFEDDNEIKATGDHLIGSLYKKCGAGKKFDDAIKKLDSLLHGKSSDSVELDIFGFSRGAAVARHFARYVKQQYKLHINFLGLFDTVESFTLNRIENYDCSVTNVAKTVFQLNALHETRENFPLTSIFSKEQLKEILKEKSTNSVLDHLYYLNHPYIELKDGEKTYIELTVPGCHADIGGGYKDGTQEDYPIDKKEKYETLLKHTIFKNILNSDNTKIDSKYTYFERPKKTFVSGRLQWVNLLLMVDKAQAYGCTFDQSKISDYEEKINNFFDKETLYKNFDKKTIDISLQNLKDYSNFIRENDSQRSIIPEEKIQKIANFIHISANYQSMPELLLQSGVDHEGVPLQVPASMASSLEEINDNDFSFAAIVSNEVFVNKNFELLAQGDNHSIGSAQALRHPLEATQDWKRNFLFIN